MKAIVTGANGFVGSAVANMLAESCVDVLALDISFSNSRLSKNSKISTIEMSVENISVLEEKVELGQYELFYHFAWVGSAGPLRSDEKVQTKNALTTVECLRTAAKIGCKKFICAGSIMEYEVNHAIYEQNTKPSTAYIYGVGKVLAHELCKPIANELEIDLVWAYITNAYGVGEKSPRFINTTLRKIIKHELLEFTSGTQNYDFIYIDDVAKAFCLLGEKGIANKGYIIGSGNARPLREFIIEMCDANAGDNKPQFGNVPFTGINLPLEVFSTQEIFKDCHFKTAISFAEGTKRTIEWLKAVE